MGIAGGHPDIWIGADEVEHLTNKSKPYPTFTKAETIMEEVQEFIREDETGFFLVIEDNHITKTINLMKNSGIQCRVVHLPYHRALLFPCLTGKKPLDSKNV